MFNRPKICTEMRKIIPACLKFPASVQPGNLASFGCHNLSTFLSSLFDIVDLWSGPSWKYMAPRNKLWWDVGQMSHVKGGTKWSGMLTIDPEIFYLKNKSFPRKLALASFSHHFEISIPFRVLQRMAKASKNPQKNGSLVWLSKGKSSSRHSITTKPVNKTEQDRKIVTGWEMIRLLMQLNPPPSLCLVLARGREARKRNPSNALRPIWVLGCQDWLSNCWTVSSCCKFPHVLMLQLRRQYKWILWMSNIGHNNKDGL